MDNYKHNTSYTYTTHIYIPQSQPHHTHAHAAHTHTQIHTHVLTANTILLNCGSRGSSAILRPSLVNSPLSLRAPKAYSCSNARISVLQAADCDGGGEEAVFHRRKLVNINRTYDRCMYHTYVGKCVSVQRCCYVLCRRRIHKIEMNQIINA